MTVLSFAAPEWFDLRSKNARLPFRTGHTSRDHDRTAASRLGGISYPRAVRRAIEYIHANLSEDVHLEDIAGAARLSTCHFARMFRKTTGMTPHRYLMQARVGKVKELLRQSELCLAAIADEAGFSDQGHMSKVFKRLTGMTPKAFRNERQLADGRSVLSRSDYLRRNRLGFPALALIRRTGSKEVGGRPPPPIRGSQLVLQSRKTLCTDEMFSNGLPL